MRRYVMVYAPTEMPEEDTIVREFPDGEAYRALADLIDGTEEGRRMGPYLLELADRPADEHHHVRSLIGPHKGDLTLVAVFLVEDEA